VNTAAANVLLAAGILAMSLLVSTSFAHAAQFSFAAFGDTPYNAVEELQLGTMIEDMNNEPLALVIHVGDFKHARTDCSDDLFERRRAAFSRIQHPFVFVPGDNEWVDCIGGEARREPLERLAKLRALFFSTPSTLGARPLPVEQQTDRGYREHLRWSFEEVLFATFNIPGPDNHAQVPSESRRRTAAVTDWMDETFRIARDRALPAVVLAMHGNIWSGRHGYAGIVSALSAHARRFDGEILVIHGDTHYFRFDRPVAPRNIHNVRRLEVFGSPFASWSLVTVSIENGRASFQARPGGEQASGAPPAGAGR
jgi:hypothetical protein